jgi:hypothetical protein
MAIREETASSQRFHRELEKTRERIETLPEGQRPHFHSLADARSKDEQPAHRLPKPSE